MLRKLTTKSTKFIFFKIFCICGRLITIFIGPNLTPPPKNKDFVEPPHRKLKTYPTFDVQGNVIYQTIDDPVPIDFDDGLNYEQYNDQEQGMMTETTNNVPASTTEERQQLRQGLVNVDALNMLKSVHGDDQDVNYKYNDINPLL